MSFPYYIELILFGLFIFLLLKTFIVVKEASAAVIERFGKFQSIRKSGLSLVIPFIDNRTATVNLRVQQLDVTIETKTLDNVFVNLQVSVQYRVRREWQTVEGGQRLAAHTAYCDSRHRVERRDQPRELEAGSKAMWQQESGGRRESKAEWGMRSETDVKRG